MSDEKVASVVELWRTAAQARVGSGGGVVVELAAPFQRHYTKLGTGLPPNWCLALTVSEAIAFKFDPRNPAHPLAVGWAQFGKQVASWPRSAVRVAGVEPGRLAIGVTFDIEAKEIPCRTPRLAVNLAAAAIIVALGGQVPQP